MYGNADSLLCKIIHKHVVHNVCAPDMICGINTGLSVQQNQIRPVVYYNFNSKGGRQKSHAWWNPSALHVVFGCLSIRPL